MRLSLSIGGVLLGSVLSDVCSESCRPWYMACVDKSIDCFVVDICVVADLKDFMMSQVQWPPSLQVSSQICTGLVLWLLSHL